MIRFNCPACGAGFKAPEEMAGRRTQCPGCGAAVVVPVPAPRAPAPRPAPTGLSARCPGCGRAIPLNGPHELTRTFECARCNTRFVPAQPSTPPLPSSAPATAEDPGPRRANRPRVALWALAVLIPAGALFLCCGGIGFVLLLGGRAEQGQARRAELPPVPGVTREGVGGGGAGVPAARPLPPEPGGAAPSPANTRPEGPVAEPPDRPQQPAVAPQTYQAADLNALYEDYRQNEAAADAKYLNKPLRVRLTYYIPQGGVEKVPMDGKDVYVLWVTHIGECVGNYHHIVFRLRNGADAAAIRAGIAYDISGVCLGKRGTEPTTIGAIYSSSRVYRSRSVEDWPVVVFRDCELVKHQGGG